MTVRLFIDSDTCLEFRNTTGAFLYVEQNQLKSFIIVVSEYEATRACKVFNPFLSGRKIEYLQSEDDALRYVGSFLS